MSAAKKSAARVSRIPCGGDGCRSTVPLDSPIGLCQAHAVAEIQRQRLQIELMAEQLRIIQHRGMGLLEHLRNDNSRSPSHVRSNIAERAREFIVLAYQGLGIYDPDLTPPHEWITAAIAERRRHYDAGILRRATEAVTSGTPTGRRAAIAKATGGAK